ncbi:MAG: isoprenylcysteine carboxylmethyltransferase family protein [Calditrichales bacterium]|nr:MAG: isoprenylcysteine carboxylmethyltransferase family protein [Calditrichales bacterium]
MSFGDMVFKLRGYMPVPFLVAGIVLANPRQDLVIFGGILMVIGELIRIAGVSYAGGATRTRQIGANELVTAGPYAYLRHPLYVGNILLYSGASILAGGGLPYLLYLIIFFFSVQYAIIVRSEEAKLTELFGEQAVDYINSVPRFFPRFTPYSKRVKKKADVGNALLSEKSTMIAITVFILLVVVSVYINF